MDFGKCFNAALLPIVAAVILGVIGVVIVYIPVVAFLMCCIGIPMMIVNAGILGWAGFNAAKEGQEIVGGVVAGVIAGGVSSIIVGITNMILGIVFGVIIGDIVNTLVGNLVGLAIGFGFWAVVGAVCGAIGALIAGNVK